MNSTDEFGRDSVVDGLTPTTRVGPHPAPGLVRAPAGKYVVSATIGTGGMGTVLLVLDRDLRRDVAMKVMRRDQATTRNRRVRFVAEAQATSQLEHPGIPPVHDLGTTTDGLPYFTMKLVRGQTLREVLHGLLLGRRELRVEYTLHRLISILERICEALHFAHEKGVVHRDLKPENIMLGDFGEVHVMDWGIARVRGEQVDPEDQIGTAGTDEGAQTEEGQLTGTVPYMSPEQVAGNVATLDRRSDVWALGCVLYEMLTLHMAFDGSHQMRRIARGDFPPIASRNPRRPVPPTLATLCERCLRVDPAERPSSARDLGNDLRAWLDGSAERARRKREAAELVEQGRTAARRFSLLSSELDAAEAEAEAATSRYPPWQNVDACLPLLEARERVEDLRHRVVLAFADTTRLYEGALLADEGNPPAREGLADLWLGRLTQAEAEGNREDTAYALDMVTRYDDGRLAAVIAGAGSLALDSSPRGAIVTLHRFENRHGILRLGEGSLLGQTPLPPLELPMGSYLCVLRTADGTEVRYPVQIRRNLIWAGTVRLDAATRPEPGFLRVPAGPFRCGEGRTHRTIELADFFIQERPVTFGDYAEFLGALVDDEGLDTALLRVPATAADGPFLERSAEGAWRVLPVIVDGPARERWAREYGPEFALATPVIGASVEDAEAYCAWRSRITGREWRLPTEEEYEKAARGVDGRRFPWGELENASLGKCRDSRREAAQPEPVGTFPTATSVYGMLDATGNTWQWTSSWVDETHRLRVVKSGGWRSPLANLRCAHRQGYDPTVRLAVTGFRCARNVVSD